MDRLPLIVVVALMMAAQFWPYIKGTLTKLRPAATATIIRANGPAITRDAAVAGLMLAVDFAHQEGRHDLCDGLGALLPGLIAHSKEPAKV